MSSLEMGPISYVVLGLVARDGPVTSYGLKQAVARGPAKLWRFPHTQLYTEPSRLVAAGLLDEEQEAGGRRRRSYTITPDGRRALERWLGSAAAGPLLLRDEALMKLYFGAFATAADLAALARRQAAAFREEHGTLLEGEERLAARGDRAHQLAVLRFGLRFTDLVTRFWEDVERELGGAPAATARRSRSGASRRSGR